MSRNNDNGIAPSQSGQPVETEWIELQLQRSQTASKQAQGRLPLSRTFSLSLYLQLIFQHSNLYKSQTLVHGLTSTMVLFAVTLHVNLYTYAIKMKGDRCSYKCRYTMCQTNIVELKYQLQHRVTCMQFLRNVMFPATKSSVKLIQCKISLTLSLRTSGHVDLQQEIALS